MIYTSYYNNVKNLLRFNNNLEFISIAGSEPDWYILDDNSKYALKYKKLAPKWNWWSEWSKKFYENPNSNESVDWYYKKYYETVLCKLNPIIVQHELLNMSNHKDVVLLCHESPDKFCHRHIVSQWFRDSEIMCGEYVNINDINNVFKLPY